MTTETVLARAETPEERINRRLDLIATVLMTIAAVATAWASFQSASWHGRQAVAQGRSIASRLESTRASDLANQQTEVDILLFNEWVDADSQGNQKLAAFYSNSFRGEFRKAFDAWRATHPSTNPHSPPTPFAMSQYTLAANARANRLVAQSAAYAEVVKQDIERGDNYLLAVVLFAVSLFFAGISGKLHEFGLRGTILALGYLLFLGTVIWVAGFPAILTV